MSNSTDHQPPHEPPTPPPQHFAPPKKRRRWIHWIAYPIVGLLGLVIGGVGGGGSDTPTASTPGATITVTKSAPAATAMGQWRGCPKTRRCDHRPQSANRIAKPVSQARGSSLGNDPQSSSHLPHILRREGAKKLMRINVYSQELTSEIKLISKTADTGITYYGVRMYLASPDILHHTDDDDDRSAITFWIPNAKSFPQEELARIFDRMAYLVSNAPEVPRND